MSLIGKDLNLYAHIFLGLATILLSVYVVVKLKSESGHIKKVAVTAASVSWLQIIPSAVTYLLYYPATKTLINAGSWPWAHSIITETKEHWGLLLPVILTVAATLVVTDRAQESKKWWWLAIILAIVMGVMGRLIKVGALQ